jgi:quercetin dioxygenase-like cupin family protein
MKTDAVTQSDARVNTQVERLDFPIGSIGDFENLRHAWTALPRIPKIVPGPDDAEVILSNGRQVIREMLTGDESAGALQVCFVTLEPGPGAPDHHQPTEDEMWFCIDGDWEWTVGEKTQRVGAGAFAYIPRNTTHRFRNVGTTAARMFTLNTPAGHERGFRRAGESVGDPNIDVRGILAAHGIIFHA